MTTVIQKQMTEFVQTYFSVVQFMLNESKLKHMICEQSIIESYF